MTTGGFAATGALNLNAASISGFTFTGTAAAGQISTPHAIASPMLLATIYIKL